MEVQFGVFLCTYIFDNKLFHTNRIVKHGFSEYGSIERRVIWYMSKRNDRVNHLMDMESNRYFIDTIFDQMGILS